MAKQGKTVSLPERMVLAAFGGMGAATFCHPIDTVRINMQIRQYAGGMDAIRNIIKPGIIQVRPHATPATRPPCRRRATPTRCDATPCHTNGSPHLRQSRGSICAQRYIRRGRLPHGHYLDRHCRRHQHLTNTSPTPHQHPHSQGLYPGVDAAYLRQWTYGSCRMGLFSFMGTYPILDASSGAHRVVGNTGPKSPNTE